jgi:uncharacterized protein
MEIYSIPIHDSPQGEKYIIFRPLTGLAFVGNKQMAELALSLASSDSLIEISPDIRQFLQIVGFFDPDPPCHDITRMDYKPVIAVPLLTNQCQLRCSYCYASAGGIQKRYLPPENGRAVIDYVCQSAKEAGQSYFEVAFHGGGEPTYSWKLLQELTRYARSKSLASEISLTSNGIWSKQQCEWIIANIDSLSLSMDGAEETQNRQRSLATGKESFDLVMQSIAHMDRAAYRYGIRMTATAPWVNLPEDITFICEHTDCQSMQVEPAFNTQRGGHPLPKAENAQQFAEAFIESYKIARSAGRQLRYSGARVESTSTVFCRAPFTALIINLNGDLVTCYEVTDNQHPLTDISTMGRIQDGKVLIDTQARERMLALIAERRESCKNCFLFWSCAGDCYARAFIPGENGHLVHGVRCDMNRHIFREMLLTEIAQTEGVWHRSTMIQIPG